MKPIRWQSIIDFLVLAFAIYLVLHWGRGTRAFRIALAIVGLKAGALLAHQLDLLVTGWILDAASLLALVLVLIAFQAELRHAVTRLDVMGWLLPQRETTAARTLHGISTAVFSLAQARRGALIVIAGRDSVADLVEGGVPLGGEVSPEILEAIFRKVSPVHDGATIIERDHISRVSAVLPLTQRQDVPRGYGTRHRAAMGLAERCDAVVIAVSEERGQVSLVAGRDMLRVETAEALVRQVQELRGLPRVDSARHLRGIVFGDLRLKAAALGLAGLVWGVSLVLTGGSIRSIAVPLEFRNLPADAEIAHVSATSLQVQLRGSAWVLDSVNLSGVVARFDLSGVGEGAVTLNARDGVVNLPPGLVVEGVSPPTVSLRLIRRAPPPAGSGGGPRSSGRTPGDRSLVSKAPATDERPPTRGAIFRLGALQYVRSSTTNPGGLKGPSSSSDGQIRLLVRAVLLSW